MEKSFKISGALFLTWLYLFSVNAWANAVTLPAAKIQTGTHDGSELFKVAVTALNQSLPAGNLLENAKSASSWSEKNTFSDFAYSVSATQRIVKSKVVQFLRHFQTLIIVYRKADMIYPFHYFWDLI